MANPLLKLVRYSDTRVLKHDDSRVHTSGDTRSHTKDENERRMAIPVVTLLKIFPRGVKVCSSGCCLTQVVQVAFGHPALRFPREVSHGSR